MGRCRLDWQLLHLPSILTLIKSSTSDDLNIQSSLTSSLSSRSSKLPLEQNSVTMANTPQSWKKPRKGLTFSWRRSFIWRQKKISWVLNYCTNYQTLCFTAMAFTSSNTLLVLGLMLLNVPSGSLFSHAQSPWKTELVKVNLFSLQFINCPE